MASASKKMWMGSSNDRTTFGSNDGGKEDLFAGSGGSCGDHAGEFVEDQNNKVNAIRFSTLNKICEVLDCQPGDLLEYRPDDE